MACSRCSRSLPRTPFSQGANAPTVFAWGPFENVIALTPEQGLAAVEAALAGED